VPCPLCKFGLRKTIKRSPLEKGPRELVVHARNGPRRLSRDRGLNITQFSLQRLIRTEKELSISTLGRYISITRALAPLERDGLIDSRPGADKRIRIVREAARSITKVHMTVQALCRESQRSFFFKLLCNAGISSCRNLLHCSCRLSIPRLFVRQTPSAVLG
jgi:DNA-binding MarR family transcriptional regulator